MKLTLALGVGSFDDQYFTGLLQGWISDAPSFQLMSGSFTKRVGDGIGGTKSVVYQLAAGAFDKIPEVKANAEGTEDQAVTTYEMTFVLQNRSIQ